MIELFRVQDRVAKETSEAYAQAQLSAKRVDSAERGLRLAQESVRLMIEYLQRPDLLDQERTALWR